MYWTRHGSGRPTSTPSASSATPHAPPRTRQRRQPPTPSAPLPTWRPASSRRCSRPWPPSRPPAPRPPTATRQRTRGPRDRARGLTPRQGTAPSTASRWSSAAMRRAHGTATGWPAKNATAKASSYTTVRRTRVLRPRLRRRQRCSAWIALRTVAFGRSGMTRTSWPWSWTKKGPPSFCGGSRRPRRRPHLLEPQREQRPPLPCVLASAGAYPRGNATWPRDNAGPSSPWRAPGRGGRMGYTPRQRARLRPLRKHPCQGKGEASYAELHHRLWTPPGGHLRVRTGPGLPAALAGARHRPWGGDALWPRGHGGGPPGLWAAHDPHRTVGGGGGSPACLAAAVPAQAGTRGPTPAQTPVRVGRQGGVQVGHGQQQHLAAGQGAARCGG